MCSTSSGSSYGTPRTTNGGMAWSPPMTSDTAPAATMSRTTASRASRVPPRVAGVAGHVAAVREPAIDAVGEQRPAQVEVVVVQIVAVDEGGGPDSMRRGGGGRRHVGLVVGHAVGDAEEGEAGGQARRVGDERCAQECGGRRRAVIGRFYAKRTASRPACASPIGYASGSKRAWKKRRSFGS